MLAGEPAGEKLAWQPGPIDEHQLNLIAVGFSTFGANDVRAAQGSRGSSSWLEMISVVSSLGRFASGLIAEAEDRQRESTPREEISRK